MLIAKGNEVNAMANSGGTSLMFAAGAGHTEAAEVLIAAGADVNAKLQAKPEFLEQVCMCAWYVCSLLSGPAREDQSPSDTSPVSPSSPPSSALFLFFCIPI